MTKEEIRSLVWNLTKKYDVNMAFHPRVIDAAIEKVIAEFYNIVFLRNPLELARYTKEFGYTTAIAVSLEAATGLYYSNYPTGISIIPIPDKLSGVRRVSAPTQAAITFYPMDSREQDLVMAGSYVHTLRNKIGYIPRRTRVEYYNVSASSSIVTTGVRMDLLIPFSNYADTDTVLIPEIVDEEGNGFVERVMKELEHVQPIDMNENPKEVKQ